MKVFMLLFGWIGSLDKICFYFAYFMTNFLLREKNNFIEELPLEALNFYHFAQVKYIQSPIARK